MLVSLELVVEISASFLSMSIEESDHSEARDVDDERQGALPCRTCLEVCFSRSLSGSLWFASNSTWLSCVASGPRPMLVVDILRNEWGCRCSDVAGLMKLRP